ncbi:tannase family, partial [Rhizoctonia solani]
MFQLLHFYVSHQHKHEPKFNRSELYRTPRLGAKTYTRALAIHCANFNRYPAGTNFTSDEGSVPNLAEFCQFTAQYNTLSSSSLQFEVWMPMVENWNGRFAHVGNGVDSGSISYSYMGVPLTKYGFAVASTNAGHNGWETKTGLDGTFAMNDPETQFDFGYCAVHLRTIFSKIIVGEYYQQNTSCNYWLGCSAGMRAVQGFPEDFDGALTGAPAQFLSRQNGWDIHTGELNIDGYAPGETIPTSFFPLWAKEVTSQSV